MISILRCVYKPNCTWCVHFNTSYHVINIPYQISPGVFFGSQGVDSKARKWRAAMDEFQTQFQTFQKEASPNTMRTGPKETYHMLSHVITCYHHVQHHEKNVRLCKQDKVMLCLQISVLVHLRDATTSGTAIYEVDITWIQNMLGTWWCKWVVALVINGISGVSLSRFTHDDSFHAVGQRFEWLYSDRKLSKKAKPKSKTKLVGGLEHFLIVQVHIQGISSSQLILFRGVFQPPSSHSFP